MLDRSASASRLGKTPGKDERQQKVTYPSIHGVEASRRRAGELIRAAQQAVAPLGRRADRLREVAAYVLKRNR
jgi:geranylgeranyl pyrophosphate synthase